VHHRHYNEKVHSIYWFKPPHLNVLPSSLALTHLKRTCRLFREIIQSAVLDEYYHTDTYFAVYPDVYPNVYLNK
jgi:hypothetical protein